MRPPHLPPWLRAALRWSKAGLERLAFGIGGRRRLCPVCGRSSRRFAPYRGRAEARCPWCSSLERHRLAWSYLQRTNLFDENDRRVLHVAPERCFEPRFRARLGRRYVTADLGRGPVDLRMDVMHLAFSDATFDVVYCSHVLEHVADDRRAMREFHRVLKKDGWALLMVPIVAGEKTYEDPTIVDPAARKRAYGQADHVRAYGADYAGRLASAGFAVEALPAEQIANAADIDRMVLGGTLYVCRRAVT